MGDYCDFVVINVYLVFKEVVDHVKSSIVSYMEFHGQLPPRME